MLRFLPLPMILRLSSKFATRQLRPPGAPICVETVVDREPVADLIGIAVTQLYERHATGKYSIVNVCNAMLSDILGET